MGDVPLQATLPVVIGAIWTSESVQKKRLCEEERFARSREYPTHHDKTTTIASSFRPKRSEVEKPAFHCFGAEGGSLSEAS